MRTLRVHDVLKDRILVSRESARLLEGELCDMMASAATPGEARDVTPVTIDFEGIAGVAPSFLDELLSVFESVIGADANGGERCLMVVNPPTRLSLKFEAVARGHGMLVRTLPGGSWLLTDSRNSRA
jgi:hypothetical protein